MKVPSVDVELTKMILFNGQTVTIAILKDPFQGPNMLRKLNFDGNKQADLTVQESVYFYPSERYDYWRKH